MSDFNEKIDFIIKNWHKTVGLIVAEIAVITVIVALMQIVKANIIITIVGAVVADILLLIVWLISNKIPKIKKNKIGFLVSIQCSDEETHIKVRDDFIMTLRKLVTGGNAGRYIQFVEIPNYISSKIIDVEDAINLRLKTKAHFVLYGRCRKRNINAKEHIVIDLDGVVTHRPIQKTIQDQLCKEFSELLPRKIAICSENDLFAFELTSEWTELVAKYIIGIAAVMSGDLNYAEILFKDVKGKLDTSNNELPAYVKMKERLPVRLKEISETKLYYYFEKWNRTYDDDIIDKIYNEIRNIDVRYLSPDISNYTSICTFLKTRDVATSIKILKAIQKGCRDAVWHLNLAFLEAYRGDLKKALRYYHNAIKFDIKIEVLNQIENFITYILRIEPEQSQLYFCLGYINWKIKEDNLQAIKDYEKFTECEDNDRFKKQIYYANKWIEEIKKQ